MSNPTRVRVTLEDRDIAHEHDMAQLRREQLRADIDDDELDDIEQARLEDEDRAYADELLGDEDDPEADLQAAYDASLAAWPESNLNGDHRIHASTRADIAALERPELRQHALDCGLDMTGAYAIHVDDAMAVYGWSLGHDVLHPETQRPFVQKGERIYFFVLDAMSAAGIDYFTINPEL